MHQPHAFVHLFSTGNHLKTQHDLDQREQMGVGLYFSVVSPPFCLMIQEQKGWKLSAFLQTYKTNIVRHYICKKAEKLNKTKWDYFEVVFFPVC